MAAARRERGASPPCNAARKAAAGSRATITTPRKKESGPSLAKSNRGWLACAHVAPRRTTTPPPLRRAARLLQRGRARAPFCFAYFFLSHRACERERGRSLHHVTGDALSARPMARPDGARSRVPCSSRDGESVTLFEMRGERETRFRGKGRGAHLSSRLVCAPFPSILHFYFFLRLRVRGAFSVCATRRSRRLPTLYTGRARRARTLSSARLRSS